ncbi:uncharacterized protein LOC130736765 [Lotus japonicus]|uniref:uncharacterized protein LOC130736765 n=1 Tax=Lotus japonicus TaxID=34305 RepID=UPI00258C3C45|nr:uncharacterized protein LOC130736765 [Lotus japonicus]
MYAFRLRSSHTNPRIFIRSLYPEMTYVVVPRRFHEAVGAEINDVVQLQDPVGNSFEMPYYYNQGEFRIGASMFLLRSLHQIQTPVVIHFIYHGEAIILIRIYDLVGQEINYNLPPEDLLQMNPNIGAAEENEVTNTSSDDESIGEIQSAPWMEMIWQTDITAAHIHDNNTVTITSNIQQLFFPQLPAVINVRLPNNSIIQWHITWHRPRNSNVTASSSGGRQDITNQIRLSSSDNAQGTTGNPKKKYKRGCTPKDRNIRPHKRRTPNMSSWSIPGESSTSNSSQINTSGNTVYVDLGNMDMVCKHCGATVWLLERAEKSKSRVDPYFSICCARGKIFIPYLKDAPELLLNLLTNNDPRSRNFLDNIRAYNSMFAFTSIGGKVVSNINDGHGPPQFIISSQNYHRIGSLLPKEGDAPKFAQLYIYDTKNGVENRLKHFRSGNGNSSIDPELVSDLIKMVDDFNRLAQLFRKVRDHVEQGDVENVALRLFRSCSLDPKTYNLPSVDEVAALIVGDFDSSDCGRDIILRTRDGQMQRIYENDSSFLPLQYPILFPHGEKGFSKDIDFANSFNVNTDPRRDHISLREWVVFRIFERQFECKRIFLSRRLFQQFVVDCYSMVESQRLYYIRNNQSTIRRHFLDGIEEAMARGDTDSSKIGSRVYLPASFMDGKRYMFNNCQDAMALSGVYGYPDLFLTMTCNPKWPEIERHVLGYGLNSSDRPDLACHVLHMKLNQFMVDCKKGYFFGKAVAGTYTIEFQKRGLPHAHILLWLSMENKLRSPAMIDSVICAELPDPTQYPELFECVSNYMVHGPCGLSNRDSPCMKNVHVKWPPVKNLIYHLPKKQVILFKEKQAVKNVLQRNKRKNSMFTAWMEANGKYAHGNGLTYSKFPAAFVFDEKKKEWRPRKQGFSIGRMNFVAPGSGELYYLRLLLSYQRGCSSFEDLKTHKNQTYETFRDTCDAMGLLKDDREFIDAIHDVATRSSGAYVRNLFVTYLMGNILSNPLNVWNKTWHELADGIFYNLRKAHNKPGTHPLNYRTIDIISYLVIEEHRLKDICLMEIEKILMVNGKSLKDFSGMPHVEANTLTEYGNVLLLNELNLNVVEMSNLHDECFSKLNDGQLKIYQEIITAINANNGGFFFVYGYGGTGKTFLWKTLTYKLRSQKQIILNVASSGIASLLLPGGRTAHSLFSIPLCLNEDSCCGIPQGSPKAERLQLASLIIWDEAPMVSRYAFEALDRTLRDIMRFKIHNSSEKPLGGKVVVLGGDFRQILPVIPKGRRAEIVMSTINSSRLWRFCKVLNLTQNMRLTTSTCDGDNEEVKRFAKWVLDMGDGKLGDYNDGESNVQIPKDLLIYQSSNPIADIVHLMYPDIVQNVGCVKYYSDKAILAPTLDVVDSINQYALSLFPGNERTYLSSDSVWRVDEMLELKLIG